MNSTEIPPRDHVHYLNIRAFVKSLLLIIKWYWNYAFLLISRCQLLFCKQFHFPVDDFLANIQTARSCFAAVLRIVTTALRRYVTETSSTRLNPRRWKCRVKKWCVVWWLAGVYKGFSWNHPQRSSQDVVSPLGTFSACWYLIFHQVGCGCLTLNTRFFFVLNPRRLDRRLLTALQSFMLWSEKSCLFR